jgi:hypothetical protein
VTSGKGREAALVGESATAGVAVSRKALNAQMNTESFCGGGEAGMGSAGYQKIAVFGGVFF